MGLPTASVPGCGWSMGWDTSKNHGIHHLHIGLDVLFDHLGRVDALGQQVESGQETVPMQDFRGDVQRAVQ